MWIQICLIPKANIIDSQYMDEKVTVQEIAQALFSKEPKEPCSCMILAYEDGDDILYVFEVLVTLLMEALDLYFGGLNNADLNEFSLDHLLELSPWFESVGFKLFADEYGKEDVENYNDYYCKIKVRTKLHDTFFVMKNIDKNYHFLLNGDKLELNNQKTTVADVYAVFVNDNNKVYKIRFDFIGPANSSCR